MIRDFYLGIIGLAVAGAYYVFSVDIPRSALADAVGAHGLPQVYALLFGGLSLVLVLRGVVYPARGRAGAPESFDPTPPQLLRAAGMVGIGVFYIVALPWIGYIPALALLIAATVHYQGGRVGRKVAAMAIAGAGAFWLLFVVVLQIPQPPGLWPALLGR